MEKSDQRFLKKLREEAHIWYEGLPPEKKAIYIQQERIRKLHADKLMWSYYSGGGAGICVGVSWSLVFHKHPPEYWFLPLILVGTIVCFVSSIFRIRTHDVLIQLEIDRDIEEALKKEEK